MAKQGTNVWYELMTSDVEGAKRFYTEVIGWKAKAWEESDPASPYSMWYAGDNPVAGLMKLPAEAQGAPPSWMAYTKVDDVDAAAAQVKELGGSVHKEPFDIPKVGRMAVLADPQGAVFAIYKGTEDAPASPPSGPGEFSWSELNTTDWEAAWKFYSQLFGWKHRESMDMGGEMGTYFMFHDADGVTKGGMSNMARMMKMPPHWLHYVTVDDVPAAVARIQSNGGKVLNGPMDIPGGDVIAQCQDPQGAFFAIYAEGKNKK